MGRHVNLALLAVSAALASGAAALADTAPVSKPPAKTSSCFRTSDIDNTVQANQSRLNIKTRDRRYFRVDMKGTCFTSPGMDPYVIQVRGSDMICSPIDLDLSAGPRGFKTPCFVDKISEMTPAEVSALPKRDKP